MNPEFFKELLASISDNNVGTLDDTQIQTNTFSVSDVSRDTEHSNVERQFQFEPKHCAQQHITQEQASSQSNAQNITHSTNTTRKINIIYSYMRIGADKIIEHLKRERKTCINLLDIVQRIITRYVPFNKKTYEQYYKDITFLFENLYGNYDELYIFVEIQPFSYLNHFIVFTFITEYVVTNANTTVTYLNFEPLYIMHEITKLFLWSTLDDKILCRILTKCDLICSTGFPTEHMFSYASRTINDVNVSEETLNTLQSFNYCMLKDMISEYISNYKFKPRIIDITEEQWTSELNDTIYRIMDID